MPGRLKSVSNNKCCMSPIRHSVSQINSYTPGEQINEPGWIKLNTNENPYGPSPAVADFLRSFDPQTLRLYPDPVGTAVRRRIAQRHGCEPGQVFAGNGSDEILALCTRAFVENDRSIAFFEPSYSLYGVLADIRDVKTHPVPLEQGFRWRDPQVPDADLFLLTSPNAPTGMGYPRDRIEEFCAKFPGIVLIDEAYADFADHHCMDLALQRPNVLVLRTLSKAYALAGIRFGYTVGNPDLIKALFKIKDSYNLNSLTQGIALAALNDPDHTRRSVGRIIETRERLTAFLRKLDWTVYPSQTNFLWIRPAGITAHELFQRLRQDKILTRWFAGRATGDYLRITIGTEAEIQRLIEALDNLAAG